MTQIEQAVEHFFTKNPDVRKAVSKALVNRRALARYIIKTEDLDINSTEAIVSALRRYKISKEEIKELSDLFNQLKINTKDKICIVSLEKSYATLQKIQKILANINYTKNETLKIVDGATTLRVFIDETSLKKFEDLFSNKEILKIYKNIAEITLTFPEIAIKTKGIVAYVASELSINNINIIEILTSTPELIIYIGQKDLLKTYETLESLRQSIKNPTK